MTDEERRIYERASVAAFGEAMVLTLELPKNWDKGGWHGKDNEELYELLLREVKELKEAIESGTAEDVARESVDVAEFVMMMWDLNIPFLDRPRLIRGE